MSLSYEELLEFRIFKLRRNEIGLLLKNINSEELLWAARVGSRLGVDLNETVIDIATGEIEEKKQQGESDES